MALTRVSSIVVDPSTLTKAYLDDFESRTLSEDYGWLIFCVLIHQAVSKRSAEFEGKDPAVFNCAEFLYGELRVFEWIKKLKRKSAFFFDSTLVKLGLTICFYEAMNGSTFTLNQCFHERVKSMDVIAILEMFRPTPSLSPVGFDLRSNSTDSETSFDISLCENCTELPGNVPTATNLQTHAYLK
jgi:hypothetical protein